MNIEKQIEFDKIKEKWEALAVTECAKEKIKNWSFCLSESELRRQIKDTTDSRGDNWGSLVSRPRSRYNRNKRSTVSSM